MKRDAQLAGESLGAQVDLVRSLAARVARDVHQAEDLSQDALIVALGRADAGRALPAGWWSGVVRNLRLTRFRGDRRRTHREREVARLKGSASASEFPLGDGERERLTQAVEALPRSLRESIQLRYFEELTAREVAGRLGCPESTVATRTAEGLRRLRRTLGPSSDPRAGARLLLFLSPVRRIRSAFGGAQPTAVWIMTGSAKLAVTASVLIAVFVGVHRLVGEPASGSVSPRSTGSETLRAVTGELLPPPSSPFSPRRSAKVAEISTSDPQPEPFADPRTPHAFLPLLQARGRVVDLAGRAVPGVEVCSDRFRGVDLFGPGDSHDPVCVTANERGEFDFKGSLASAGAISLHVRSEGWATVYKADVLRKDVKDEVVIVVAPRIELGGVVQDPDGARIPDATVAVVVADRPFELPGNVLNASVLVGRSSRTDRDGVFRFEEVAELDRALLRVSAPGYRTEEIPFPRGGNGSMAVVLRPLRSGPTAIMGRVLLPSGEPACDAWVSWGHIAVQPDVDGYFAFDLASVATWGLAADDEAFEIYATQPGYLPAFAPSPSVEDAQASGGRAVLLLELGQEPRRIRGRAVDRGGAPVAGLDVRAVGQTPFGMLPGEDVRGYLPRTVEEMLGGGGTTTDSFGRFELTGLLERDYRVEVLQTPSLLSAMSAPVAAGSRDVEIVLDVAAAGAVAGRVVDPSGEPIENVRVHVSRNWPGRLEIGSGATTDAQGRFHIARANTHPAFLRLEAPSIVPELFHELAEDVDPGALELVVSRRCWLQIDFGDWSGRASTLQVLDAQGEPVDLVLHEGRSMSLRQVLPLGGGLSPVFTVGADAASVVLYNGEDEVTRYTIQPTPGEVLLLSL